MPSRVHPFLQARSPRVCVPLLALVIGACSRAPDARQVLDSIQSWTATARFSAEELRAGATTVRYTAQIRDAGRDALDEVPRQLAGRPIPPDTARQLRAATDSLAAALHRLDAELGAATSDAGRRAR